MYNDYTALLDTYQELLDDLNGVIEDIDAGDTDLTDVFEKLKKIHPYWNE